ncbi:hypothetical protein FRB96_005270 [Tulasnella sp. 330]|nr:hypothetical protein FRB96_005270 [Tulasnella sp. 330]KAG8882489.1 hypothetical protein FRB98_003686 [Tulasnella sp. 332]
MKVLAIGASRNIGYHSTLQLLQQGHHVVYLLRKPSVFDANEAMKPFIDSGVAEIVQGDALVADDLTRAWAQATVGGPVDVVLFTLGSTQASFSISSLSFTINPPNLCTAALLNTLTTLPHSSATVQPRFIITTSFGVTKASHSSVPLLTRPLYSMIKGPHADKMGMESICTYSAGWTPGAKEKIPSEEILTTGWEDRLPGKGWMKHVVILRPALLTDGPETGKYRVGDEKLTGVWTVSRKDVAHFIVTDLLANWEKYEGKGVSIAY